MAVTVCGASDDLIEVEGDIDEEFPAPGDDAILGFSNGVVLRVLYDDDGIWRITPLAHSELVKITYADTHDEDKYTDVATMASAEWVVCGVYWAKAKESR